MIGRLLFALLLFALAPLPARGQAAREFDWQPQVCEVVPLAGHRVSMRVGGSERCRWHHGSQYPRPFFFPLLSPGGAPLTRLGHPGAENHDHHRSLWFAFHDVDGENFWADGQSTEVRQLHWYAYRGGDQEALLATRLGWFDSEGVQRLDQDLIAALRVAEDEQYELELQAEFRVADDGQTIKLGKTNFGFLAIRVAESLSVHFGGGQLTSSQGARGEAEIFGQRARWVDYSGPLALGSGSQRQIEIAGITFIDHPDNPRHPSRWHVREDGWMGASLCMDAPWRIAADQPLQLRYLLSVHRGWYDSATAEQAFQRFAERPPLVIRRGQPEERHRQYVVERAGDAASDR